MSHFGFPSFRLTAVSSAGYPIIDYFTRPKMTNLGGYNLGGINSTGMYPVDMFHRGTLSLQ
jgi:hypothetical protein